MSEMNPTEKVVILLCEQKNSTVGSVLRSLLDDFDVDR